MRRNPTAIPASIEVRAGRSPLLSRLYRDVGMAAVAAELELNPEDFEPEVGEALARGARYLLPRELDLAS
jgi:hypothetical protein